MSPRTYLITGAAGMLGSAFREVLSSEAPDARVASYTHRELDVTDLDALLSLQVRPDYIIHCAAEVNADRCETDPAACRRTQVEGTANVAELAARTGASVLYPQSFLIFDGTVEPITEQTPPAPLSVYGRCKLEAEQVLVDTAPDSLIVRMGGFFGGDGRDKNFVGAFCRKLPTLLAEGVESYGVGDRVWQPTYTLDLARNCALLMARGEQGVFNMAAHGEAGFFEVAREIVAALGLEGRLAIERRPASEAAQRDVAERPVRSVLLNNRLAASGLDMQRSWKDALHEYLERPFFRSIARACLERSALVD